MSKISLAILRANPMISICLWCSVMYLSLGWGKVERRYHCLFIQIYSFVVYVHPNIQLCSVWSQFLASAVTTIEIATSLKLYMSVTFLEITTANDWCSSLSSQKLCLPNPPGIPTIASKMATHTTMAHFLQHEPTTPGSKYGLSNSWMGYQSQPWFNQN